MTTRRHLLSLAAGTAGVAFWGCPLLHWRRPNKPLASAFP